MLGLFKRQTTPQTTRPQTAKPRKGDPQDQRPAVVQPFRQISTLLVGGGLAVAALAVSGIGNWSKDIGAWFQENLAVTQSAPKVDIQSLTINKIRGASELTTLVFSTEAIIPTGRDLQLGQVVIGSTKLLYIAHGEVRAGIDLSDVKRDDVVWDGNTLTITLPPPKILDSKIDVTRSRVYDYNRGFLGLGPDVAPQLMVLAQQKALETVIQSACDRGLMAQAGDRAKTVVGQLLGGSLTDATTTTTAAALPNLNQPVIEIIVPDVDKVTCASAQGEGTDSSTGSVLPDGAIAPDTAPKTAPAPVPNSVPVTAPSPKNTAPQPDAPLPVPALP